MYLIYGNGDGKIWREVEQYEVAENGDIHAGMGGVNTLTYPAAAVDVSVLELSDEQWAGMDREHLDRYRVSEGAVVPDPDYRDEETAAERLEAQVTYTAMMTDTLLEV